MLVVLGFFVFRFVHILIYLCPVLAGKLEARSTTKCPHKTTNHSCI